MIDHLADTLFGGHPTTGRELDRMFAHRAGFRAGFAVATFAAVSLVALALALGVA